MQEKPATIRFLKRYRPLFDESYRNIVLHGGRNSGKSWHTGNALILRGRMKPLRILCTREIQNTIRDSVHKLLKDSIEINGFTDFEVTNDSIRNRLTGTEYIFKGLKHNINEIKSMEGIDICWVEEAQSITKESLDILVPTIRKPGSQLIFTFNRYTELDPVYVKYCMNTPPGTYVDHVNYDVLERAGMLSDVIRQEIENDRPFPELFAHKWLGEPIGQSANSVIPRGEALAAMQREVSDEGAVEIGVDVARMGDDRTVLTKRKGLRTIDVRKYEKLKTTEVCDMVEDMAGFDKSITIKVDDTGVGGGVSDDLERRGYTVVRVNFGASAGEPDKYPNVISEAWFYLRSLIGEVQIPFDQDLLMELTTRQWKIDAKGRRCIESKDDYKKRGYRSPDYADSLILCYMIDQTPMPNVYLI